MTTTRTTRRDLRMWGAMSVASIVIVLGLSSGVARAQAPAPPPGVSPTGSIDGLEAKFIDVKGVKTRYYEAGTGEAMVLVHGEGWSGHSSANTWSKNIPGLAKRFHVFAADKMSSGMTGNPLDDKDYNIQGEVEHMYQFILAMKVGKVHLVGQSRGGGCVFFLAIAHPEIVKTLTIVDTGTASPVVGETNRQTVLTACPKEPDWAEWQCRLRQISHLPDVAFDEKFFQTGRYMASLPKSKETIAKRKAGAGQPLEGQFNEWKKEVHARVLKEPVLMMPTLLYWGKDDPSAMLKNGLALLDVISVQNPQVRMIIANNSGHFHYREHPEEWNRNVINFIDYWSNPPAADAQK
ncbi:MAG: alpha/beta hydrolase [Acidobacteriota bacterium]